MQIETSRLAFGQPRDRFSYLFQRFHDLHTTCEVDDPARLLSYVVWPSEPLARPKAPPMLPKMLPMHIVVASTENESPAYTGLFVMGGTGLEPVTSGLSSRRSPN